MFNQKSKNQVEEFGLTQPQFSVLECLGHLGPLRLGDLSKKMLVTGGSMTVVVDNLTKIGLVERLYGTKDCRTIYVQLTSNGIKLFQKIFTLHADYVTELASVLTEEEQLNLSYLLKKLGTSIQQKF